MHDYGEIWVGSSHCRQCRHIPILFVHPSTVFPNLRVTIFDTTSYPRGLESSMLVLLRQYLTFDLP